MVSTKRLQTCKDRPSRTLKVSRRLFISQKFRSNDDRSPAEIDHWQLNELESISAFSLDYRFSKTLQEKVYTVHGLKNYLETTYCGSVAVEFEHIIDEDEKLWLYENYEQTMHEPITNGEKIKALQLLLRTECME